MKRIEGHNKRSPWLQTIPLAGILMLCIWALSMPACVHDPFSPIDPGPIDTTGNPIDTMDVDTMDGTSGHPCSPDTVYFSRDILPLLKSNCAKSGCHDAISHQDGIILDNFQHVMSSDVVRAFRPDNSDLFESITETNPNKRMPEPPNQPLTADQIDLIEKWILQGAKDLSCDDMAGGCDTTGVTYSTFVAPLLSTYCVGCHSGAAPSGNIALNSYAGVRTQALNGKLVGAISWANGYQPMPKGSNKLSECKINKIKAWIHDGAQNN